MRSRHTQLLYVLTYNLNTYQLFIDVYVNQYNCHTVLHAARLGQVFFYMISILVLVISIMFIVPVLKHDMKV